MHRHARAMLIVFFAVACERPDAPLLVTANVEPPVVILGDSTQVTVSVINRSSKPQMIAGGVCGFDFVITTLDGTVVGPNAVFCSADLVAPRVIAPGATILFSEYWTGGSSAGGASGPLQLLPAGSYRVTGAIGSDQYAATSYVSAPLTVLPSTTTADGAWSGAVPFNGIFNFTLVHSGTTLSGTWSTIFPDSANDEHGTLSGSVHGARVSFSIDGRSIRNCAGIEATLQSQNSMSGLFSTTNCLDGLETAPFTATRH